MFQPLYPLTFFRCLLSLSVTLKELQTEPFIHSLKFPKGYRLQQKNARRYSSQGSQNEDNSLSVNKEEKELKVVIWFLSLRRNLLSE